MGIARGNNIGLDIDVGAAHQVAQSAQLLGSVNGSHDFDLECGQSPARPLSLYLRSKVAVRPGLGAGGQSARRGQSFRIEAAWPRHPLAGPAGNYHA